MFVSEKMQKLNIFVKKADLKSAVVTLAKLGQLHLSRSGEEDWSDRTPEWRRLVDTFEDRKHRVHELTQTLRIENLPAQPLQEIDPEQDPDAIDATLQKIEAAIEDWQEKYRQARKNAERCRNQIVEMRLLSGLDTPVEALRETEYLHRVFGTIPRESLENLKVVLFRVPFVIIPIQVEDRRVLVAAATSRNYREILERALQVIFFEPVSVDADLRGRPAEVLPRLEQQRAECEQRLADLEEKRADLAKRFARRLSGMHDRIEGNLRVARAVTGFDRQGDVFLISGWIPQTSVDAVMTSVQTATDGRADLELVTPLPGGRRRIPTLVRNPALLRPFEKITATFGYPDYGEIDPTPLVAVSFVLMYGMMFGDIGHGLMLAALGVWIRQRFVDSAAVGTVLMAAGISASIFGFFYGSLFGREDILPALWLHPLDSILEILTASIIAGVALINIGFLIHVVKTLRIRNWGALFFDRNGLSGICLYWAVVGGGYAVFRQALPVAVLAAVMALPAVLIFLQEPLTRLVSGERPLVEENWATFGVQALFETFETLIRFVSNTLSFVRLGAFAVAHAGFVGVVFSLAETGGEMLRWPVILIGTLIVVGFEGLIVGIQALRLEYYEFFGKFYQGGGRPFAPLRLPETGMD